MELITIMEILLQSLNGIKCSYKVIYDMNSGNAKIIITGNPEQEHTIE